MFGIRVKGATEAARKIRELSERIPKEAVYRGILATALDIWHDAAQNAPIEFGNLRGSFFIITTKGDAGEAKTVVSPHTKPYDDGATEQAKRQSEMHVEATRQPSAVVVAGASYALFVEKGDPNWNWNDGGPGYMENAYNKHAPETPKNIADEYAKMRA